MRFIILENNQISRYSEEGDKGFVPKASFCSYVENL